MSKFRWKRRRESLESLERRLEAFGGVLRRETPRRAAKRRAPRALCVDTLHVVTTYPPRPCITRARAQKADAREAVRAVRARFQKRASFSRSERVSRSPLALSTKSKPLRSLITPRSPAPPTPASNRAGESLEKPKDARGTGARPFPRRKPVAGGRGHDCLRAPRQARARRPDDTRLPPVRDAVLTPWAALVARFSTRGAREAGSYAASVGARPLLTSLLVVRVQP